MNRPIHLLLALAALVGCGRGDDASESDPWRAASEATSSRPALQTEVLSPDLLVLSGFANGNVLAVRLDSSLVLVDAQSEERVPLLEEALAANGFTSPVEAVVNTHYHTDHVGGNARFGAAGARIVAHASAWSEMSKDTFIVEMDWRRTPAPVESRPTVEVSDSVVLGAGDATVIVRHVPRAHTGGDLVAWLPVAGVIHMGDIVEIGARPLVDRWAGGSLSGMIEAVRWALSVSDETTRIVPGHGPVIDRDELGRYLAMLETEAERCAAGLSGLGCD